MDEYNPLPYSPYAMLMFIQHTAQINKKFQLSRPFMKSVLIEALIGKSEEALQGIDN